MIRRRNMNIAPVDGWTLGHIAAGVVAGALRMPFGASIAAAVAYEFVEQGIERTQAGQRIFGSDGPESLVNAVVDVGVFAVGHLVGDRLR